MPGPFAVGGAAALYGLYSLWKYKDIEAHRNKIKENEYLTDQEKKMLEAAVWAHVLLPPGVDGKFGDLVRQGDAVGGVRDKYHQPYDDLPPDIQEFLQQEYRDTYKATAKERGVPDNIGESDPERPAPRP